MIVYLAWFAGFAAGVFATVAVWCAVGLGRAIRTDMHADDQMGEGNVR